MGLSCPCSWCLVQAGERCAVPAVAAVSGDDWDKVIEISSPCWGSQARCYALSYLSSSSIASITGTEAAQSGVQHCWLSKECVFSDKEWQPPQASSRESWPALQTDHAARAGPALPHALLQSASPVHSQAEEHWSLGGNFCPKSGLFGQGWSEKKRQRHPYTNREELLLQSSFQIRP